MNFTVAFPCPKSVEELFSLNPMEFASMRPSLERLRVVLGALGDPQKSFPSLLVAGTNGKGSTSTFLASGLCASGLKTGLFTSPHLLDPSERILIQGKPLPQGLLEEAFEGVLSAVVTHGVPLSFFEWITALMFLAFAKAGVDVGVLEVGMGGRFDATNLAGKRLACVITSIGRDHTRFLGDRLGQILIEKASIARAGAPLFVNLPQKGLHASLEAFCDARGIRVVSLGRDVRFRLLEASLASTRFVFEGRHLRTEATLRLLGEHQAANASLALAVLEHLAQEGTLRVEWPEALRAVESSFLQARMQRIGQDPLVLLDGAHNVQGMMALVSFLKPKLEGSSPVCLVAMSQGKEVAAMLKCLRYLKPFFVFPEVTHSRLRSSLEIAEIAKSMDLPFQTTQGIHEAFNSIKGKDPVIFTGSLYFAGEVLKTLGVPTG